MSSELKINFSRCLCSKKFKYSFSILFAFTLLSFAVLFKEVYKNNSLNLHKTTDYSIIINSGEVRTIFLIFILAAPFICTLMYSDSYIEEKSNNMFTIFLVRVGKNKYLISKFITIFIVTFGSVFFVLGFTEVLTWIAIPDIGVIGSQSSSIIEGNADNEFLFQNIYNQFPHLYNFIIIGITSLFCSLCALLAFNLSLIFNINKIMMVISTFLIVNATTMILPEEYQIQMFIQTWPAKLSSFVIVMLVWTVLTVSTFIIGLKKEII